MSGAGSRSKAALRNSFVEYSFVPTNQYDLDLTFNIYFAVFQQKLISLLQKHHAVKFQLKVHLFFTKFDFQQRKNIEIDAWFSTDNVLVFSWNQTTSLLRKCIRKLYAKYDSFVQEGSGWVLSKIDRVVLVVAKYKLYKGGCAHSILPSGLKNSRAILRVSSLNNDDRFCFLYAVSIALNSSKKRKNKSRFDQGDVATLNALPYAGFTFPIALDDVVKFEKLVNFAINVYGYEPVKPNSKVHALFPYYISDFLKKRTKHVDLLFHKKHFYPIVNLASLLKKNKSKNQRKGFVCRFCLSVFTEEKILKFHETLCTQETNTYNFPSSPEKAKKYFNSWRSMISWPFVIYADLESQMLPLQNINHRKQISKVFHETISWASLTVCRDNPIYGGEPTFYTGSDAIKHFLAFLESEFARIRQILLSVNYPIQMTEGDQENFEDATHCWMCNSDFDELPAANKVKDHNHLNGNYRAALCNTCNLRYALPAHKVAVIFHGLSNYDSHFLIRELHKYNDELIRIIPRTSEKYLSFAIGDLIFKDSYLFLSEKLETLALNLKNKGEDNFEYLNKFVPLSEQRDLLFQKGFFPYSYLTSTSKLEDKVLPPPSVFYNDLTETPIEPEQYLHAQKVWSTFDCQNLGDYLKIYLLADLLLLTDVFETFRSNCLQDYQLDPVHYFSSAHLTMDAFLRFSGVTLDLFTDVNKYLFVRKAVRGGLSMVSKRFSEAVNKYLCPSVPDVISSPKYLLYLDANNLYGWAMMQPLPFADFVWKDPSLAMINVILNLTENVVDTDLLQQRKGYLLEVDLEYPDELHHQHNDFPLAPEKHQISFSELSPFAKEVCVKHSCQNALNVKKLFATLHHKQNYVVYYRNLKLYMQLGLRLKKVHKILEFSEAPIMKSYIEFNSLKRAASKNSFDSNFYKFLSNSLYGKTMERPENKTQVKLINNIEAYEKYVSRANFKQGKIIHQDLISLELKYPSFVINKPSYIGAVILELAKFHMYNFHYTVMKPHFQEALQLLYTDTDSLLYEINCVDVYQELAQIQRLHPHPIFDFSNYPKSHFLYDDRYKKVPGLFKDETAGVPPKAFVGLRSKMYSLQLPSSEDLKHAKGVKKVVIDKSLSFDDFKNCLFQTESLEHDFKTIRSVGHRVFTSHQSKKTLSSFEDKRWLKDCVNSLAYGHFLISEPGEE